MEKIICKECRAVIFSADYPGARAALDKHIADEHSAASDSNTQLLSACYAFLTTFALGVRSSKLKALRLCQRIKELSPDAAAVPTDLPDAADPSDIPGTPESRAAIQEIMRELGLSIATGTKRTSKKTQKSV